MEKLHKYQEDNKKKSNKNLQKQLLNKNELITTLNKEKEHIKKENNELISKLEIASKNEVETMRKTEELKENNSNIQKTVKILLIIGEQ